MPLTPSPRARAQGNASPFTPPKPSRRDPDWHADKKKYTNAPRGSLQDAFASLSMSTKRAARAVASPVTKSNIASNASPLRLDLGVNDWSLNGSGTQTPQRKMRNSGRAKQTMRINGDRFIPTRGASSPTTSTKIETTARPTTAGGAVALPRSDVFGSREDLTTLNTEEDDIPKKGLSPGSKAFNDSVAQACGINPQQRILAFKPAPPESSKPIDLRSHYNRPLKPSHSNVSKRRILSAPERVLDAPNIVDDYYLNLLDWGAGNQVAIGLERSVYVWNAESGTVNELCQTSADQIVTSVKWSQDGGFVAIGTSNGEVQIWDAEDETKLRTMRSHDTRVGVMSWNKSCLSTGARSGNIYNHDVRIAEHKVAELLSHTAEVCGLEWRSDGSQLASGGNDNMVHIWDARSLTTPKFSKANHNAAVKALAWCPWQLNLLATGGGTFDRQIHFWNTTTGARVNTVDAGSQVTSLKWSQQYREIVSSHGGDDNQLTVWSYPTLTKTIEIPAHESRILHSSLSPDGQMLATAAADESLKFWKLFEKKPASASASSSRSSESKGMKQMTIR